MFENGTFYCHFCEYFAMNTLCAQMHLQYSGCCWFISLDINIFKSDPYSHTRQTCNLCISPPEKTKKQKMDEVMTETVLGCLTEDRAALKHELKCIFSIKTEKRAVIHVKLMYSVILHSEF